MTTLRDEKSATMQAQYAAWPYPQVPLLASLPSTHPWELHVDWLWDRSGSGPAPAQPRIWIAGCGTFQPYAFAVANPQAEIVATDLSEPSLAVARRRCAVHRQRHVRFAPVDLADESTWPDGAFDLIECYGVLMNLADPAAALRGLRQRLTPGGVLRVMVYPQHSRQRVFQLQRVAHLLGLHAGDRRHPGVLRRFVAALPKNHPLRFAFTTYADSRNDAGVVDGFLHAGDRGFTATQLVGLLQAAGLEPAFWFHRPWAQPDRMATRLGFEGRAQSFVLDHLDLWQELRSNYVVCARRADAPPPQRQPVRAHPMFCRGAGSVRHRLRLERLRWLGGALPDRTGEGRFALRPAAARALRRGRDGDGALWLGGAAHRSRQPAYAPFPGEQAWLRDAARVRAGERAPNPLYAHLFAAFELDRQRPELGLPTVDEQVARWTPWADPLEQRPIRFGLTPYATWQRLEGALRTHLERDRLPSVQDYEHVRLRGDRAALARVRRGLAEHPDLPCERYEDSALRELFVLLFTQDRLFVTLDAR
ncbi:MAG: class I SAM-dependent methyltransferase [Planctomycetota bacterium]